MYGKRLTATTFPDYKLKAVNSLLRDLAVFVFVLSIALIFHYQSVLDFYHTNIERLLLGIYIFYMMWVGISVVMLYVWYFRLNTYFSYENGGTGIEQLNELKRMYEEFYDRDPDNIPSRIHDQVQFHIMRQSFISPVELPVLTECFLRRDFDFSKYLGYWITDFVSKIIYESY